MVADLPHLDAMPVVTLELMRGARGFRGVTQVILLIRFISTVIVPITDIGLINAAPVLAGELMVLAGRVGALPLIAKVTAVVLPVTPEHLHDTPSISTCEFFIRASSPGTILLLIQGINTICITITDPRLGDALPVGGSIICTEKLGTGTGLILTVMPFILVTHVPAVVIPVTYPVI